MELDTLKTWIESFVNEKGKISPWLGRADWLEKKGYQEQHKSLIEYTSFFPEETPLIERIIAVRQNITARPVCKGDCGKFTNYFAKYAGFAEYCSSICSSKSEEIKDKRKVTNNIKFGADYNLQTDAFKEQSKKTLLEKYGVDNAFKSEEVREKYKETCRERYGVENTFQIPEVIEKLNRNTIGDDAYEKLHNRDWLYDQHVIQQKPLSSIALEIDIMPCNLPRYLKMHGIEQHYNFFASSQDKEILKYIQTFDDKAELCTHDVLPGFEIDVYSDKFKFGVEHHGIYWHSYEKPETQDQILIHQKKAFAARRVGVRLFQIFGNEWETEHTKDIWKSMITNYFGKSEKIFARKCKIVEVSSTERKAFLNMNHLQGNATSSIDFGLMYNNELVSLMTFGKSRFNGKYDYELIRYANKKYTSVVGGASRIFNHFVKHVGNESSIISYCDLRHSNGNLYKQLGFEYLRTTNPNYFYFKVNEDILYSRQTFQKHKLKDKLEIFDEKLTESENMFANGYRRIWDAGNLVYFKGNKI